MKLNFLKASTLALVLVLSVAAQADDRTEGNTVTAPNAPAVRIDANNNVTVFQIPNAAREALSKATPEKLTAADLSKAAELTQAANTVIASGSGLSASEERGNSTSACYYRYYGYWNTPTYYYSNYYAPVYYGGYNYGCNYNYYPYYNNYYYYGGYRWGFYGNRRW